MGTPSFELLVGQNQSPVSFFPGMSVCFDDILGRPVRVRCEPDAGITLTFPSYTSTLSCFVRPERSGDRIEIIVGDLLVEDNGKL